MTVDVANKCLNKLQKKMYKITHTLPVQHEVNCVKNL